MGRILCGMNYLKIEESSSRYKRSKINLRRQWWQSTMHSLRLVEVVEKDAVNYVNRKDMGRIRLVQSHTLITIETMRRTGEEQGKKLLCIRSLFIRLPPTRTLIAKRKESNRTPSDISKSEQTIHKFRSNFWFERRTGGKGRKGGNGQFLWRGDGEEWDGWNTKCVCGSSVNTHSIKHTHQFTCQCTFYLRVKLLKLLFKIWECVRKKKKYAVKLSETEENEGKQRGWEMGGTEYLGALNNPTLGNNTKGNSLPRSSNESKGRKCARVRSFYQGSSNPHPSLNTDITLGISMLFSHLVGEKREDWWKIGDERKKEEEGGEERGGVMEGMRMMNGWDEIWLWMNEVTITLSTFRESNINSEEILKRSWVSFIEQVKRVQLQMLEYKM